MPTVIPYPPTNGTIADGTQMQADFAALLAAVNNALLRDGSIPMLGALAMGGYKIGGVADPTLLQDVATVNWVQNKGYITASALSPYLTTAAAATTYAPLASPAFTGAPTAGGNKLGYLDLVGSSQGVYTLVAADEGQTIFASGNQTIPANASVAFPIRTVVTYINVSGAPITIAITTDTLTLHGSTLTGTRTVANNGIATIIKTNATAWLISGDVS